MKKYKRRARGMRSGFANNSMRASGLLGADAASRGPIRAGKMRKRGRGLRGGKWWESLLSGAAAIIPALL